MSIASKNTLSTVVNPKHKNHFSLVIDGINPWQIKSCARPSFSIEETKVSLKNVDRKFAGKISWENLAISMYDFVESSAPQQIITWVTAQHNPKTGINGLPITYKKDIILNIQAPNLATVEKWKIYGAWVQGFDGGENSSEDSAVRETGATIVYDWAELLY